VDDISNDCLLGRSMKDLNCKGYMAGIGDISRSLY
jgi:hypothetical protein